MKAPKIPKITFGNLEVIVLPNGEKADLSVLNLLPAVSWYRRVRWPSRARYVGLRRLGLSRRSALHLTCFRSRYKSVCGITPASFTFWRNRT